MSVQFINRLEYKLRPRRNILTQVVWGNIIIHPRVAEFKTVRASVPSDNAPMLRLLQSSHMTKMATSSQSESIGSQLDFDGNPAQPMRQHSPRATQDVRYTQRDLEILSAIHAYGGVLTTVQLACLFWPPDLRRRLHQWEITNAQIQDWLARYPQEYLYEKMQALKWLQKIERVLTREWLNKADQRRREWLNTLKQAQPEAFAELMQAIDSMNARSPGGRLIHTVRENVPPPNAFALRSQQPSDFISSACTQRLRMLQKAGAIAAYEQPTRLSEGRGQTCWFLSKKGRNLIAQMRGVSAGEVEWKRPGSYGQLHLAHRLAINDFRIAMHLACVRKGYTIKRWIDDNALKRLLGPEKVVLRRLVDGEEVEESCALKIPDGFFWVEMGKAGERHCWFELDNATLTIDYAEPNPKDYAQKIRTMSALYTSGRYRELFPEAGDSMWYLTVTTGSDTRVHNLKTTAERVIGSHSRGLDRYWFATSQQIPLWEDYFALAVFEPIWWRAGQQRLWALDEEPGA